MNEHKEQQDNQTEKKRDRISINDVSEATKDKFLKFRALLTIQKRNVPEAFDEALDLYLQRYSA